MNKFLQYIKYFFFIGFNWDFKLAFFTIYHEVRGEKRYGIQTTKLNDLKKLSIKGNNINHAEIYQGSNYFLLEKVFDYLQSINADKNIVDYGCGKGRVLAVAAWYGFDKITGVEFAQELCEEAKKNMAHVQQHFPKKNFKILNIDVVDYAIEADTNVFFFFNPFDEIVMLSVVKNILSSLKKNPREAYIVYLNPVHKEIFLSAGFEEIYHFKKLQYIQASILMKGLK